MDRANTYYPLVGKGAKNPPDYARVAASLTDEDLVDEVQSGAGDPGYRSAVSQELLRRAERRDSETLTGALQQALRASERGGDV